MREKVVKVLTVSDTHSVKEQFDGLRREVERHKPDVLACVGDMLNYESGANGLLSPGECARRIAALPCEKVVFVRGNHEHDNWLPFEEAWRETGRELITLHGEAHVHGPLVMVGFPCLLGDEDAFRGTRPFLEIDPSHWLNPLLREHPQPARTLWLMHEPPLGTPLSVESGVIGGQRDWMAAVEKHAPRVVVFGHDHKTPIRRQMWHHRLDCGTLCINAGQDIPLRTALLTFRFASSEPSLPIAIEARCPAFPEAVWREPQEPRPQG